jgi:KUP system potassium uptake protein
VSSPRARRVAPLALGALGVVFGDIGTSPLYAFQQIFTGAHTIQATHTTVYGSLSLVFWTLTLVVTVKYVLIVMHADNDGEGGIMALAALTARHRFRNAKVAFTLLALGVFGAALFYGDSIITPAVSVLSAIEGLEVAQPSLQPLVVPLAIVILVALFAVQRVGTARVGGAFGPIMLVWFATIAVLGVVSIAQTPAVLAAINPAYGVSLFLDEPKTAFLSLGSVILCVTGAEALYADMGHFGAGPIRLSWFVIVTPALYLNYLGQGALVTRQPGAVTNPFYELVPDSLQIPMVVLATMATVIASQAVITGAFSLSEQAMKLRFLPRMTVLHTSAEARGQIYVPFVNWALMIAVVGLVLGFRSSDNLASAYGLAVSGTFVITTILITVVARTRWRIRLLYLIPVAGVFLVIDLSFFFANLTKISHGGWFPLVVAGVVFTVLMTWYRGRVLYRERTAKISLTDDQLEALTNDPRVSRVPGTTVYLTFDPRAPLALAEYLSDVHIFRTDTIQLVLSPLKVPYAPSDQHVTVETVFAGYRRVTIRYGFMEQLDLTKELRLMADEGVEVGDDAIFVVHSGRIQPTRSGGMQVWRKRLYAFMTRNAVDPAAYFRVGDRKVIEFTSVVPI